MMLQQTYCATLSILVCCCYITVNWGHMSVQFLEKGSVFSQVEATIQFLKKDIVFSQVEIIFNSVS